VFLPALLAFADRVLPDAALDSAYASHLDDSTIGSNFCQALILKNCEWGGGWRMDGGWIVDGAGSQLGRGSRT